MATLFDYRKQTGSYYTDAEIAHFLARWAIQTHRDRVLEPSFGEGVFLEAIEHRLDQFKAPRQAPPVGVDLDRHAVSVAKMRFPSQRLLHEDFFALSPNKLGLFDAVLGNPPFIRYHHFSGENRKRALDRAREHGVKLSELTSAWAPFLLHAMAHLCEGGRLAMVIPYEITYAIYARPLAEKMAGSFGDLHILTFQEPLFPEINERTVLLLADDFGEHTDRIAIHRLHSIQDPTLPMPSADLSVKVSTWVSGRDRASLFHLPETVAQLYRAASDDTRIVHLGDAANVGIGYVTGDNHFFHLNHGATPAHRIPSSDIRWALRKGSDLNNMGLTCTPEDVRLLADQGGHQLFLPNNGNLDAGSAAYIAHGEKLGVHWRYKCRVRSPWYVVPGVRQPEMFLNVMMTNGPRLVVNRTNAVGANSLLLVDRKQPDIVPEQFAAAGLTSLAQLSAEIEGHALGGGALKFEPSEARRWLLPARITSVHSNELSRIDELVRDKRVSEAQDVADHIFLIRGLGWSKESVGLTRQAIDELRTSRRKRKGR